MSYKTEALIKEQNRLEEAEDKAKKEGNPSPFAFISEISKKLFVF